IEANALEIAAAAPRNPLVVELGSGSGSKTRTLLQQFRPVTYCPIDISPLALAMCARDLAPIAEVAPIEKSYVEGLREAATRRRPGQPLFVLFLGSTIGNFEPDDANEFLYAIGQALAPGDALLLGTDLVKPVAQLLDAYDDPTGVTAA